MQMDWLILSQLIFLQSVMTLAQGMDMNRFAKIKYIAMVISMIIVSVCIHVATYELVKPVVYSGRLGHPYAQGPGEQGHHPWNTTMQLAAMTFDM